jgi:hypothetical protein
MAGINKNFKVQNGLEVATNLIIADSVKNQVGIATTVTNYTLHVNGGIGATSLYVSGITTSTEVKGVNLSFSGVGTIGNVQITSGIITAVSGIITYYGDGAKLTNVNTSGIATDTTNASRYVLFTNISSGSTSTEYVSTSGLVFNPSSSNLGVAVTSPFFAIDVSGDTRVRSTGKMRFGGTTGTTNFYIQYNSTANSLDFVAG